MASIDAYRTAVSPLFAKTGLVVCRYEPTCSLYAREAIVRFGFARGSVMAAWRVIRCNPLSKGGADPVPVR